jgi:thiol-disulfide isomerase/thioredoxin/sugar lactone lactonase YvrE
MTNFSFPLKRREPDLPGVRAQRRARDAGPVKSERIKVRAPHLQGRGWLNTGGQEVTLAGLRGRIVLLDFWTFACVNCLHVLEELRPLEERFAGVLVTIGVHSPKFVHEADPAAVRDAVERYAVHHAVLDDFEMTTWDAYAAKAWPTLVVIDPNGYVVAHLSGEGHANGLAVLIEELITEHEAAGTLRRGDSPYVPVPDPVSRLRFPGKVIALEAGRVLVSDTAHHQLVELDADLVTERRRFGTGERGLRDGMQPWFAEPQGLLRLPAEVAAQVGYDVLVADSVNHALRGLRLADGLVRTVAGTGEQLRTRVPVGASSPALSTPWDLAWWPSPAGPVTVAMAGSHQLWAFDPVTAVSTVIAGTTVEGLRDGSLESVFFAQPSGLATGPDGTLWVADAETSALREVRPDPQVGAAVSTVIGHGLFDFGFRDGDAQTEAMMQHPLGVAVLADGSIAVADTFNGAVRRYDPRTRTVRTLARDLNEPSDLLVDGDALIVVESAAHRLVRLPIPAGARVDAGVHRVRRSRTDLAPGPTRLVIAFTPPTGQHLDARFGDPTSLTVTASPPELLAAGAGTARGLTRVLELSGEPGAEGVLQISVAAAACDEGDSEFAACHRYQQDWGIPVRLGDGAPDELVLQLRGV